MSNIATDAHDRAQGKRFSDLILQMLDGIFARLSRRNVKAQESSTVYIEQEDADGLRQYGRESISRIRGFLSLIK